MLDGYLGHLRKSQIPGLSTLSTGPLEQNSAVHKPGEACQASEEDMIHQDLGPTLGNKACCLGHLHFVLQL